MKKNWTLIAGFLILEFLNFEQAFCQTTMPVEAKIFKALVDCNNPPNIICAPDFHGCPGGPEDPNATGYAKASPGGPNCSTPLVSFSDRTISTGPCVGQKTIQRIWVAEDPEKPNLRNFCIQYLYFQDSIAPVFTQCPKDTLVNSNENCVALVRWESPFVSDACGRVCVESSLASGSSFTEGKHIVTYTATDACGNKSTCSFSITVVATCCTAPPVIHCTNDFNGCPQGTEPGITGNATASPGSPFCATPILTFRDSIIEASGCTLKLIRIWIATDPDHPLLTSTCLQKIDQSDTQKPSIICPPNLTLQSDPDCKAVATWVDPVVSDNCSNTTLAGSHVSGSRFNSGITTVTYTATDDCGNSASCSFTITVIANCCNNNPIIVCPSDFNGCPQGIEPAITGTAIGKPFQAGCPDPVISFTDQILYQQGCSLRVMRTWIAQDPTNSNLSASCNQVIDLHDIESPNIICPAHITVASNLNCKAIVQWNEPATSDNCSRVTLSSSLISGSEFSIGTTSVAYTASDACGNTATCRFNITVEDSCCNNNPIIICPTDFNGCPQGIEPAITGNAIGKPCRVGCPEPVISFTDLITYQQGCSLRVVRTWLAQDPTNINLSTSCDQVIDLHDIESPNIICPANITVQSNLNCKAIVHWTEPTTSDNCSRVTLASSILSGSELNLGNTDVIYTATDACGNTATCQFTVTVEENCCNQNPTIVCPPDFFGCPQGIEPAITGSATSTRLNPNCQPAIITYKDEIMYQQGCSLRVERTWTAADSIHPNLLASCVQTIDLKDIESPNIICPANITAQPDLQCNAVVSWNNPGTSDNCSRVTLNSTHVNGGIFTVGITDVIYTATDACGNSATCTFRVTVTDDCCNKAPIIVCPRDYNGCPQSTDPSNTGIATGRAAKVGCPDPIISYTDEIIYQQPCSLRLARTWRATDPNDAQLFVVCAQVIDMYDKDGPNITCPSEIFVMSDLNCSARIFWSEPLVTDECSIFTITSTHQPGDSFGLNTTVVTFTATDACGNLSTCSFNVNVIENCCYKPPVITCVPDYFSCPGSTDPIRTGTPLVTKGNNACGTPLLTYRDDTVKISSCVLILSRTWTAQDSANSNLFSTCIQNIALVDTVAPVMTNCPANFSINPNYNCDAFPTWTPPIFIDQCSSTSITTNHEIGSPFNIGNTEVIYTATDACGNNSTCSFVVTVTDSCCNKPPTLVCPNNYQACPSLSIQPEATGFAIAVPGSDFCGSVLISYRDSVITTGPCPGALKIARTWIAKDSILSQLSSQCKQLIELSDQQVPRFTSTPRNITVDANGNCEAVAHWTIPVALDNCGIASLTSNYSSGSTFTAGNWNIIYTVTDYCGNSATTGFTVSVQNTEVGISCPNDTVVYRLNPQINGALVDWQYPSVKHCTPCIDSLPGFIYMGEHNGHRYFCSKGPESWVNAQILCDINGGKLAVIEDADENQFIASKLNGQTAWIGGTDRRIEGLFEWHDGALFKYQNWMPGQPNHVRANDDYIELFPDGTWNDQDGNESREFVCEITCFDLKQIAGPARGTVVPCGHSTITYVASKDGKKDTCSFDIKVDCDSITKYCNVKAENSKLMWIDRLVFANIDNRSGDNGGYHYFNTQCGELTSGQNYNLCVTPGFLNTIYNVYWKIWIDYNADGFFSNNEQIVYGYGNTTMCANIQMPPTFVPHLVRMRIAMSYGSYPKDACSHILFGEIEDYCISLNGGTELKVDGSFHKGAVPLKCLGICDQPDDIANIDLFDPLELISRPVDVRVIPNPANEEIQIKISKGQFSTMSIFNSDGKMVLKKLNEQEFIEPINTYDWNNGMYFLLLETEQKEQILKRFVIQH